MGNINVPIPDELHKELKVRAAIDSITIKQLVVKFIEKHLEENEQKKKSR